MFNLIVLNQMMLRFHMSVTLKAHLVSLKLQLSQCKLDQIRGKQGLHYLVKIRWMFWFGMMMFNLIVLSQMMFILNMSVTLRVQVATLKWQLHLHNLVKITILSIVMFTLIMLSQMRLMLDMSVISKAQMATLNWQLHITTIN